jgi:hypothetical protein
MSPLGNPRYGFIDTANHVVTPADGQGGGSAAPASPYVPRTVGAPQPTGQPLAAPAPAPTTVQPPSPTGQPVVSGQPSGKPNTIATPDYTVNRIPGEDRIDAMAANDPNPANASLYTRARNIMLGNEPAPLMASREPNPSTSPQ